MRNVSDKSCIEIKTHMLCSITFFLENLVIDELMWKNIVELDRPQMTIYYVTWALHTG
jgi:hypothetical protein